MKNNYISMPNQLLPDRYAKKPKVIYLSGCRHVEVRWQQVPHPRYGTQVPHFVSWEEETECTCVAKR